MPDSVSLSDKFDLKKTRAYMTGIDALVRLPLIQRQRDHAAGINTGGFISGYRGSPLGGVDQAMWSAESKLKALNIVFQPGINEDLAATAVWGSQQVGLFDDSDYDGVFGMWYGKGPGVDRSMDVIKHANAAGTSKFGGVLAIAGDDHASKSSTLPHQSEHMFIGASVPVLCPANVQEVLDMGIIGWALSRYCGSWVALKAITENMDSAISADLSSDRVQIQYPVDFELPKDGVHIRWPDKPSDQETRLNKYKIYAAREFARVNKLNKLVIDSHRPRLGIITSGKAYLDVMQALEDLGISQSTAESIGLRVFKVGMSWPLEPTMTHTFAEGLEEILVVEEKRSIIEDQLTGQLYNWPVKDRPKVVGEFDEFGADLLPNISELTPAMIARALAKRMTKFYFDEQIEARLAFYDKKEASIAQDRPKSERIPHYCSGCPHSTSTQVPEGSRTLGGIGCHYMGTWEVANRRADTFTQMGGEGITWMGQAPFSNTRHVFQNLGDGTYFHSGILAIRQAVAAKLPITYKILYNDAVAMTGGQPIDGPLSVAQLIDQVRAEGIERIALVSDYPEKYARNGSKRDGFSISHRDDLMVVQDELRNLNGVSVLIYEQTCAAEKRRRRRKGTLEDPAKRLFINSQVCEGCGDCGVQSNCLSILPKETELGRKRVIEQTTCNKDYSCVKGFCPSFVTVEGGQLRKTKPFDTSKLSTATLPEPIVTDIESQPWNIVITGVGGTGVLTIAAIVSMAAHIEGKGCATLNQTGLAQKFGAVVSHVRIGSHQEAINAVRVPAGDADLLIGCDLGVSVGEEAIAKVNIDRSYAIVNDHTSTTAQFISDRDYQEPNEAMRDTIKEEVGSQKVAFVEATAIAKEHLGDVIGSNMFLLGYACQTNLLPVSYRAIMEAIELNGVAVKFNQSAFNLGRCFADNPAILEPQKQHDIGLAGDDVQSWIDFLGAQVEDYQGVGLKRQFIAFSGLLRRNKNKLGEQSNSVTVALLRAWHKTTCYKDEYEVARLFSSNTFWSDIDAQFEGDFRVSFNMAPPFLSKKDRYSGRPLKRSLSPLMRGVFKLLQHGKHLRGGMFDVFGKTAERRAEQAHRDQFRQDVNALLSLSRELNSGAIMQWLKAVNDVRGYGYVKEAAMKEYSIQRTQMLAVIKNEIIPAANFIDAAEV